MINTSLNTHKSFFQFNEALSAIIIIICLSSSIAQKVDLVAALVDHSNALSAALETGLEVALFALSFLTPAFPQASPLVAYEVALNALSI